MNLRLFLSAALLTTFISCSNKSGETVDLQLKYKQGDEQTIITTTETSSGSAMSFKSSLEMKFKVESVSGDDYSMSSNVVNVKYETKMDGETESYDSDKKESEMSEDEKSMHEEFGKMLNTPMKFTMNKKGKIVNPFTFSDGTPTEQPVDMNNIQIEFPKEPVKVGSTWNTTRTNSMTKSQIKSTYTIKEITADKIIIEVDANIGGIKGLMEDNKAKGEYSIDKTTHQLITGKLEMQLQTGGMVTYVMYRK